MLRLSDWLEGEPIEGFSFDGTRWIGRPDIDAEELADALGREVLDNYADREWLERRLERLGYDRLAAHVRGTLLPPAGNTRTGDFGEIVAGLVVRRHLGFLIPVQRLRYKDSPSGTQRLIDVVAFKFREPPELTTIAVSEVKTRTGKAASIAADAAKQLADAVDDLALSLSYIDRRLTEQGKHALAERVLALLDPQARYELDKHVFVVTDVATLHEDALDRLEQADGDKDLAASIVLIAGLKDVISDSYQAAENFVISRADYEPRAIARVERLLETRAFTRDQSRLRAEDLLREVNPQEREELQTLTDARRQRLKAGAYLLRATALTLDTSASAAARVPPRWRRRCSRILPARRRSRTIGGPRFRRYRRPRHAGASPATRRTPSSWATVCAAPSPSSTSLPPARAVGAPGSLDFYAVAGGIIERDLARLEALVRARQAFLDDVQAAALDGAAQAEDGLAVAELVELIALGELLAGLEHALRFWRTGHPRSAARAEQRFAEAERLTLAGETPESWLITNSAREIFAESARASTWRIFRRHVASWGPLWDRYLRQLANQRRPVVELWPSQRAALEAGLLDPTRRALIVRTPTSSGKTRMAEAAIVDAVSAAPEDGCCVYIVPFRALATEMEATLGATLGDLGIRVSSLFGGYETSELEDFLLSSSNVLILTPEKLDLLLRSDPAFARAFEADRRRRGPAPRRRERARDPPRAAAHTPASRCSRRAGALPVGRRAQRRPGRPLARSHAADAVRAAVAPDTPAHRRVPLGRDRGRIDYEGQSEFFVPYVLRREQRSLGLTPKRRQPKKPETWPGTVAQTAAALALHFQRIGPVVVFAAQPRNCAAVCKALATALWLREQDGGSPNVVADRHQAELDELLTLAARHLGADHELVAWLRLGIAYHHARVPEALRVRIEDAFRGGALQILACTTTLSQGVNLPVKTLIVSHTLRGENDPVSVRDFWNIAGRAGRANRETRGQVILVESPTGSEAARQRRYLDQGNIEPLRSRLLDLLAWLVQQRCPTVTLSAFEDLAKMTDDDVIDPELGELLEDLDVNELEGQVLALLCEEVVDSEDLETAEALLGTSLAGVQLADLDGPRRPFARFVTARARAAADAVPDLERRMRYYRTGLSVDSCLALDRLASELAEEFGATLWTDGPSPELRDRMLTGAFGVTETAPSEDVSVDLAVEIGSDWMAYASMEELRARYASRADQLDDPVTLNLFVQASLANGAPWSLSALIAFLSVHVPEAAELSEGLRALPALMKFGVDSPRAAYASTLAAEDRETARTLAEMSVRADVGEGFRPFMEWMSELRIDELRAGLGPGPETDRLARRVARLSTSNLALQLLLGRPTVVVSVRGLAYGERAAAARRLNVGDRVVLRREPENPFDSNAIRVHLGDGAEVGYVAREAARGLAGHLDADPDAFEATVREIDIDTTLLRLEITAR